MKKKLTPEVIEGFYYDEANHLYYFDGKPMTGCTTILNVISKPALIQWAANMAVDYIDGHCLMTWDRAGQPIRHVYPAVLEEARKAHAQKRDKAADEGTIMHETVEEYVKWCIELNGGKPIEPDMSDDSDWKVLKKFVAWAISENIRFISSEQKLYSKELFVAGTADLIFEKDGKTFIGDIKCKDKIWSREPFFQCSGYALMYEEMSRLGDWRLLTAEEVTYPRTVSGYCVIRLKGDEIETLWSYDTEGDTEAFKAAVTLYRALQNFSPTKTKWKN